jgi:7,8-dihydropterin-6-yl-methyl-4-(beta-D-ribofuranosyl)aminobenzene 5'-phosphate synthase
MQLADQYLMDSIEENFSVSILYNEGEALEGYIASYGFSALIYNKKSKLYTLFDTGNDSNILIHNLKEMGVTISDINKIIISHDHQEHSGGLKGIYEKKQNLEIYIPIENQVKFNRKYPFAQIYGVAGPLEIDDNMIISGQLGNYLKEQSLLLKTNDDKNVLFVGCCHPGLYEIFNAFNCNGKVKAIIGGLHDVRSFTCLESVDFIGACHCTRNKELIKLRYPDKFHEIKVGENITF